MNRAEGRPPARRRNASSASARPPTPVRPRPAATAALPARGGREFLDDLAQPRLGPRGAARPPKGPERRAPPPRPRPEVAGGRLAVPEVVGVEPGDQVRAAVPVRRGPARWPARKRTASAGRSASSQAAGRGRSAAPPRLPQGFGPRRGRRPRPGRPRPTPGPSSRRRRRTATGPGARRRTPRPRPAAAGGNARTSRHVAVSQTLTAEVSPALVTTASSRSSGEKVNAQTAS